MKRPVSKKVHEKKKAKKSKKAVLQERRITRKTPSVFFLMMVEVSRTLSGLPAMWALDTCA